MNYFLIKLQEFADPFQYAGSQSGDFGYDHAVEISRYDHQFLQ